MNITAISQFLINAIALGGVYALTTLGLVIVFGIMRLVNFAYGELLMVAGYALWWLTNRNVPWLPAVMTGLVLAVITALGMERISFRPLRGANPTTLLITSFAVSTFLQTAAVVYVYPKPVPVYMPSIFVENFQIGDLLIPKINILSIVVTLIVLVVLTLFLKRTLLGISLRAAAEDFTTTRLMGIRADSVVATAFAIQGLVAGIVVILWVGSSAVVYPTMGLVPVLIAFMAGIVGGMENLTGAIVGGFLVGFLFTALATVLPDQFQAYRQAILFGLVVLILVFKPLGLISSTYTKEVR